MDFAGEKRKLREHARPNYCDEEEIELPAKRSRHMGSECKIRKNTGAPASRKRNLGISSFTDPISVPNEDKGPQIMTEVVATNCKLSNRIVDLNNILLEKMDDLLAMQKLYLDEKVKNLDLKTVIAEKDSKIIQLERTVKEMKEAQFCDDLIQLDESIPLNDDDELINEGAKDSLMGSDISPSVTSMLVKRDQMAENGAEFNETCVVENADLLSTVKPCFVKIFNQSTFPEPAQDEKSEALIDCIEPNGMSAKTSTGTGCGENAESGAPNFISANKNNKEFS